MKYLKLFDSYSLDIFINPDILKIGTKSDYINYIGTIFPETIYSNIFQHQTKQIFSKFTKEGDGRLGKGFYFTRIGNNYIDDETFNIKYVLLDIRNPLYIKGGSYMRCVYDMMDDRKLDPDDVDAKILIKAEVDKYFRHNYDCIIGDKNGNIEEEYKVFHTEQIYILGNSEDIMNFQKYKSK
jgi:hypothetical protein